MFQGTKIHIIIQIPIIYAPKNKKMMPEGPNSFIIHPNHLLRPSPSPPLIRSFALENTSMKPRLSREGK